MQEGDYDAASVASVPAQNHTGSSSVQGGASGKGAAVAARMPIQEDIEDGEAHHSWLDGSEYFGEWRDGRPNGRGIFVWPTGVFTNWCRTAARLGVHLSIFLLHGVAATSTGGAALEYSCEWLT